jgi:CRP-like cAMP-binding protein
MDLLTLDSLPPNLRDAIAFQDLAAGQTLFDQGEPTSAFFMIETGRVRLVRYISADKMVTFQVAGVGESLAEMALFSDTYPCAAVAEVASQVIVYPKQLLLSALRHHPDLAEDFMAMLVRKIQALKVRLELRDIRAAHARVLEYLRYQVQAGEQRIVILNRPLKEVAADLGLTPESLSRALKRLEQDGTITRMPGQIALHESPAA